MYLLLLNSASALLLLSSTLAVSFASVSVVNLKQFLFLFFSSCVAIWICAWLCAFSGGLIMWLAVASSFWFFACRLFDSAAVMHSA